MVTHDEEPENLDDDPLLLDAQPPVELHRPVPLGHGSKEEVATLALLHLDGGDEVDDAAEMVVVERYVALLGAGAHMVIVLDRTLRG